MSQLLGYFYVVPISIAFFLVLWWVRKSQEPTHRKPVSWGDAEKRVKQRNEELGQEV